MRYRTDTKQVYSGGVLVSTETCTTPVEWYTIREIYDLFSDALRERIRAAEPSAFDTLFMAKEPIAASDMERVVGQLVLDNLLTQEEYLSIIGAE